MSLWRRSETGIEKLQKMQRKKPKKIDLIVRGVLIYWIIFVAVAWITFWVKDSIPDTLVQHGLVTGAIEIMRDKLNKED